ncbi:unnamed protein product [Musa acuminata subsp. malaccensis]|uniref:(wild Malaysian banana) hypothetical protein n=1 Tax=Musa acuminata subsp. malaccensis TaxID=214687 RepID=A0A804KWF5_MUSAM|nr:unnamed protein product [Musa acuminata subsp. malaccensis]
MCSMYVSVFPTRHIERKGSQNITQCWNFIRDHETEPVKVSFVYSLGSCEKEQRLSGCSFCLSDFYLPLGGHVTTLYVQPFRVCRRVLKPSSSFASPADGISLVGRFDNNMMRTSQLE